MAVIVSLFANFLLEHFSNCPNSVSKLQEFFSARLGSLKILVTVCLLESNNTCLTYN